MVIRGSGVELQRPIDRARLFALAKHLFSGLTESNSCIKHDHGLIAAAAERLAIVRCRGRSTQSFTRAAGPVNPEIGPPGVPARPLMAAERQSRDMPDRCKKEIGLLAFRGNRSKKCEQFA